MSDAHSSQPPISQINNIMPDAWHLFRKHMLGALLVGLILAISLVLMVLPLSMHWIKTTAILIVYLLVIAILPAYGWGVVGLQAYHSYNLDEKMSLKKANHYLIARSIHIFATILIILGVTDIASLLLRSYWIVCILFFAAGSPALAYAIMGSSVFKAFKQGMSLFWRHPVAVLAVNIVPFVVMLAPMIILFSLGNLHVTKIIIALSYLFGIIWFAIVMMWVITTSIVVQKKLDPEEVAAYVARQRA